ncbi:MAG: 1-acyl-sn-glycerol-3-phosphate acyltransferase [Acetobacteraceae bacterium]|nr:1-acyl-sn-glycerol-3-phosphate acyltransferase [Acetobacteraceae bacterium]
MIWLRSAAFNLWFYATTVVLALTSLVVNLGPAPWVHGLARLWARTVLGGLRPLCGITVLVSGREHLPTDGPALIASQHQSAFDTVVWLLLVPQTAYVLKQELTKIPLYGGIVRRMGMIAVDRSAGAAAIRALLRGTDAAVAQGRQIVIFPEGTRAPPGVRLPLHPGIAAMAARSGLPVIPVVTDSGSHWGRRAFRKQPGTIHIAIQPPLPAGMPRAALMARLEALYAAGVSDVDKSVGVPLFRFSARPRKFP